MGHTSFVLTDSSAFFPRGKSFNKLNKTHPTRADQLHNSANYITERMEGLSQMFKTRAKLPTEDDWWDFTPPESGPEGWMHTLRGCLEDESCFWFFFNCSSHSYLEYEIMSSRPESRSAVVLLQRWSRNGMWPVPCGNCTSVNKPTYTATTRHANEDIVGYVYWWKGDSVHCYLATLNPSPQAPK